MARGQLSFKETDVRRAIRAFVKEGLPVQGGRIDRNGNIQVFTGKPDDAAPLTKNEWDEVIDDAASAA
jgi:hypothetical protein